MESKQKCTVNKEETQKGIICKNESRKYPNVHIWAVCFKVLNQFEEKKCSNLTERKI